MLYLSKRATGVIKLIMAAMSFFVMAKINEINYWLIQEGLLWEHYGLLWRYYIPREILFVLLFISILATYAFFVSAIVDIVAGDDVIKLRKIGVLMWVVSIVLTTFLLPYGIWYLYRHYVLTMLVGFSITMALYNLVEYLRLQRKNVELLKWYNKQILVQKIFELSKRATIVIKLIFAALSFFAMLGIKEILYLIGQQKQSWRFHPWNEFLLVSLFMLILATYAFFVSAIVDILAGDDLKKLRKIGMLMWVVSMVLTILLLFVFGTGLDFFPLFLAIMLAVFSIGMVLDNFIEYMEDRLLRKKATIILVMISVSLLGFALLMSYTGATTNVEFFVSIFVLPLSIVTIIEIFKLYTQQKLPQMNNVV
jgi:hypothetical protein